MRKFLLAVAAYISLLAPAAAQTFPSDWYWQVGDTNPTTQVWKSVSGQMVVDTTSSFTTFLTSCATSCPGLAATVTGVADNGSGACRLTVISVPGNWATSQTKWVASISGATGCNSTSNTNTAWTITVIDSTHVDLQGSTFGGVYTSGGVIGTGTLIDTLANLNALFNGFSVSQWPSNSVGSTTVSGSTNNLTNPMTALIIGNRSGASIINLPPMGFPNSPPINQPITIIQAGSGVLTINAQDGSSLVASLLGTNDVLVLVPTGNSSLNGSWRVISYNQAGFIPGTAAAGQLFVGQSTTSSPAWETMSGDCTNTSALAMTCTRASKVVTTTYDLSTASGTQAITGVGFQPSTCSILASVGGGNSMWSSGVVDSALNQNAINSFSDSSNVTPTTGKAIVYENAAASASQIATITAYGADGFTLTWVKTGSPTGTLRIIASCAR